MTENALDTSYDTWAERLSARRQMLELRAPDGWSVERLEQVVLTAIQRTPKLRACAPHTILSAVYELAELGLYPGGSLGQAYLVPFRSRCQLIIGYKGLIALAMRSGIVSSVDGHVVYRLDAFDYEEGSQPFVKHKPSLEEERGEPIAAYAIARMANGAHKQRVMSIHEIHAIRNKSSGYQFAESSGKTADSPWHQYKPQMAVKTVMRQLLKTMPLTADDRSSSLVRAMELDAQWDAGIPQDLPIVDADFVEQGDGDTSELDEIIDGVNTDAQ